MKKVLALTLLTALVLAYFNLNINKDKNQVLSARSNFSYWFLLHRASNVEYLYYGVPGDKKESELIKIFQVKTGVPGEKPTPLPQLLGREYWIITEKRDSKDNPETSPYFLKLDIPVGEAAPYGPEPYFECEGQCNWQLPGDFGLHGTGGKPDKLAESDPGSSGCIRHLDSDIAFLFNLLEPGKEEIRYYIEDL